MQNFRKSDRRFNSIRAGVVAAVFATATSAAFAQVVNARIDGAVKDATGALIPQANIQIKNDDTGVIAYHGVSNGSGHYEAPQVVPGKYTITVDAPGFKKQTIANVNTSLDQRLTLDFTLQQGDTSETVTVTSDTQQNLNQSDATLSTLITPSQVQDLPLPNRDITSLFLLVPGVAQGSNTNSQNNAQLSFNGGRTLGTNPLLDGTSLINASTGQIDTLPSPDAISEVKIITSNASAEYGRTSGATILFSTRSGTNKFHGSVYNLLRNEDLNANTFNAKLVASANGVAQPRRGRDRFIQYGGAIGGPVRIPFLYNGKDRTFFFFNYDETRNVTPSPVTLTLSAPGTNPAVNCGPGSGYRGGDFSAAPATVIIRDPLTKQPFANNIIPCSRIDAAALKINALLPTPNSVGSPDTQNGRSTGNFTSQQSIVNITPKYTGRFDENISDKLTFFGSVNHYLPSNPSTVIISPLLNTNSTGTQTTGWDSSVGSTYVIRPTLIAQFHMGFYRSSINSQPTSLGTDNNANLGIANTPTNITPQVTVSGFQAIGANTNTTIVQLNQTVSQDFSVTKIAGRHNFKFGEQLRRNQFNRVSPTGYNNGLINFNGSITSPTATGGNPENAQADFLLGQVASYQYELPQPKTGRRNYNLAFFVQDDWKATDKLVLNLGVRQEYESPLTINNNIYSRFDPTTGVLLVAGQNADPTLNTPTPKINIGPHVGFAYTPNPTTVVRAGFTIAYGNIFSNLGSQVNSPGFDIVTNSPTLSAGTAQATTLSQGIPLTASYNFANPAAALGTGSPTNPISTGGPSFFSLAKLSSNQQFNVGIQQLLPLKTVLEIDYVHSHSIHLPLLLTLNQPQDIDSNGNLNVAAANAIAVQSNAGLAANLARPLPNLGGITGQGNYAGAHYDALQVSGRRQFTGNVAFIANYTWSKAIDNSSGIYNFSQPSGITGVAPYNPAARAKYDIGLSAFDQRNALSLAVQLTSGGNKYTKGFRLDGIFIAHSGLPQGITQSGSNVPGTSSSRPDGDARKARLAQPYHSGAAIQYYKPTSDPTFPFTPTGALAATVNGTRQLLLPAEIGNGGRNTGHQPGEETLNMAFSRTFVIHEGIAFQFRVDALNALNHTNLSGPNSGLSITSQVTGTAPNQTAKAVFNSGGFGQTSSAYSTRQLQLLTRITF